MGFNTSLHTFTTRLTFQEHNCLYVDRRKSGMFFFIFLPKVFWYHVFLSKKVPMKSSFINELPEHWLFLFYSLICVNFLPLPSFPVSFYRHSSAHDTMSKSEGTNHAFFHRGQGKKHQIEMLYSISTRRTAHKWLFKLLLLYWQSSPQYNSSFG